MEVVNSKRIVEATDKKSTAEGLTQKLVIPEVVEYSRVGDIDRKINIAMEKSQLYVGIFGQEYSSTTVQEFNKARDRGMTTMVYYFTDPPAPLKGKSAPKTQSKFYEFLTHEVYPRVFIRGNYKRVEIKTRQELEDEIVVDIVTELTLMIRQYHGVQKAVNGFEL